MTNLQSPGRNLRVPAEGFQKKLIKRGDWRWQNLLHVCVCVFAINPIFILLFSRLNPCVNPNIYKQYVFQTKLPGLFGVNFLFLFHQRMWTSFCLVIWYPLVMIFFKVDLNILLFACEASWNLWKPLCFWCDIPTLTPWLRITVIWYCYTVDIPLRSSSWLSGSC